MLATLAFVKNQKTIIMPSSPALDVPNRTEGLAVSVAFVLEAHGPNYRGKLARNCLLCTGEEGTQEELLSSFQYGVC